MSIDRLKESARKLLQSLPGYKEGKVDRYSDESYNYPVNLAVSLVLDCSGSVKGDKLAKIKESSKNLITRLNDKKVALGLVPYGGKVRESIPLTTEFETIKNEIQNISAHGDTPFYKAVQKSSSNQLNRDENQRIMVINTDGLPSFNSESSILDLGERIKEKGITIITIGIGDDVNKEFLRRLASTPEDYYFAKAPKNIGSVFNEVAGSLVEKAS